MALFALLGGLPEGQERWMFHCPGCECGHQISTKGPGPRWTFNGDVNKPTVSPSILVRGTVPITEAEHAAIMAGGKVEPRPLVCHSYVQDGKIQFLSDSTHRLSGTTVPLADLDL